MTESDRTSLPATPELRVRALAFSNACNAKDWRALAALLKTQADEQARACDVTLAPLVTVRDVCSTRVHRRPQHVAPRTRRAAARFEAARVTR